MTFKLGAPFVEIPETRFGGLFTEADARDLPPGGSWLAQDVDFIIAGLNIRPGLSKYATFTGTPGKFQWVKSALIGITEYNIGQDTTGGLWSQPVSGGNWTKFYSGILNSSRAISFSANLKEYICLSNLTNGTDQPRQWDGTNLDRVSQVGPGVSPTVTPVTGGPTTDVAAGDRYGMLMYLTRSGFLTPGSPPVKFTTTGSNTGLTLAQVATGPANVLARYFAFTAAKASIGGPYYYVPAKTLNPSGNYADATIIEDNTTTTVTFNISDTVLQAGIDVSTSGNNAFQIRELGEPVKGVQYSGRSFYIGCRNKVDQFVNLTFDGGYTGTAPIAGWTETLTAGVTAALITSPIFGFSMKFLNGTPNYINPTPAAGTLPANYISQGAAVTAFNTPILTQGRQYSYRATVWTSGGNTTGQIMIALYSASLAQTYGTAILCSNLSTSPQEFAGSFNYTASDTPPSDLKLVVYPENFPPNADFVIDRIEVYDTNQPILGSQVIVSYAENDEAFDGVTGLLDISNFTTDPIRNIFLFLNTLYIATSSRWFSTQDNGTTEPAGWTINEVSNAVGCLGPLAEDVGEEYMLTADVRGVFLFDGGNHIKVSQEIQQLWESLEWSQQRQVWLKNDRHQQRIMIGVPIPQTTPWTILPTLASPTYPNVMLMCSYLTLAPGSSIALAPGVTVSSFTGSLINREGARKWAVWSIPAYYGDWLLTSSNDENFVLCSSTQDQLYLLDSTVKTDDGAAIPEYYGGYGFSDTQTEQALQLGSVRKLFPYASILMEGSGNQKLTIFPETTSSPYSIALSFPMISPAYDDTNIPLNVSGNRMFLRFGVDGTAGSFFALRRVVMGCVRHPRVGISGVQL